MVKRAKQSNGARVRHGVERLEDRELLSNLIEGLAPNDLAGTTVSPLGNIFDDSAAGLVGDDFAISAPGARVGAGDVYIVFGGPYLNPQPAAQQGCIQPPARVQSCSLLNTYLSNRVALRILGARAGDLAGFSVAGVGNAIGDSRPDVLIGAPGALNSGGVASGRVYLIGGEQIASVISTARTAGGTAVATIDLGTVPTNCNSGPTVTIRCFDGVGDGDQAGNSVAGLGEGFFIVGAPRNGSAPKQERGAVYVFAPLRGTTGSGTLSQISTVLGPSFGAHLGGVPFEELTATGYRGYGVSGIGNPALIPVADELPIDPRYDVLGGFEPDALVGAPDACTDNACTSLAADRNGLGYLLSGTGLITIGGTFDLSEDADLKSLSAIPVQGAGNGDRFGSAVGSGGDFDGDNQSDFMFSAPRRDVGATTNAGEIYFVFGREVDDTPFPDGNCQSALSFIGAQMNFRQCRDAAGSVVPLNAGAFIAPGNLVGLTLRGDRINEQAGVALADAGNVVDPAGFSAVGGTGQIGVNEIVIGSPFRDLGIIAPIPAAGRAYVLFGSTNYQSVSGESRVLGLIGPIGTGQIFDGRAANGHYGISVAGAGNLHDPVGAVGDEVLIGANHIDVTIPPATTPSLDVGEVELLFGSTTVPLSPFIVISPLPFVQPGPFGPQIIAGGFWSFTNHQPPAGSVSQFPFVSSQPQGDFLFPPYTLAMLPNGSLGPFVPARLTSALFYPDKPLALVDRTGNLNVFGGPGATNPGANVTATLHSPKLKPGTSLVTDDRGNTTIFAVDQTGHLIEHVLGDQGWYAIDLTKATGGPSLAGNVSVQRLGSSTSPSYIVSGRTLAGETVIYAGNDATSWGTANLTQLGGGTTIPTAVGGRGRGAAVVGSLSANYAINGSGHLIEYRSSRRGWLASDITASSGGPPVQGDVAANVFLGGSSRATLEVFARSADGHLIRYFRAGRAGWIAEDISTQVTDGLAAQLTGSLVVVSSGFGQRYVYAQAGTRIVEFTSGFGAWQSQELPMPNGTTSVIGPIAATTTNGGTSRVVYGYLPNGSLVKYASDGTAWNSLVLGSNTSTSAGSQVGTLLDLLADLGTASR